MGLIVLAPWWKTWWAYSIWLGCLTVVLYYSQLYFFRFQKTKKALKDEQLTREREESLRKMQLTFFTNISHDLRTPLTLIIGNLHRIVKRKNGKTKVSHAVNAIENNINRLLLLTNEMLDFRKIESGQFKLQLSYENIMPVIKRSYFCFYDHALERGIKYECHGSDRDIFLHCDHHQLEKVIFNLLSNAFKFTPDEGAIRLLIEISEDAFLKVALYNSGEPLSTNQQRNIFNRFYQNTDQVMDRDFGPGVGIGLSIVKDIIELHKGEIEVHSGEQGTTFTIYLPLCNDFNDEVLLEALVAQPEQIERFAGTTETLAALPVKDEIKTEKGSTILIAEDNYELRKLIVSYLQGHYQILEAENGKKALDLALKERPDLVLSDVMMSVMNGIELCLTLKTDVRTSHIPVILLTARKSRYFKLQGLETGADYYLNKPFFEDELKICIKNLLKVRRKLLNKFALDTLTKPEQTSLNSLDQKFIEDLCQVIENHIDDTKLNAETISRCLNMSHSLVYKKLKLLTGSSLVEFVRDFRLQKAEMLLVQDQLSIAEISYRVGFSDRNYFSLCFKNKYKRSPREYLNVHKSKQSPSPGH